MINAQEWLENQEQYNTKEKRANVKTLYIHGWDENSKDKQKESKQWTKLESDLDLTEFTKLEELDCSFNKITNLKISKNAPIKYFNIGYNLITNFDFESLNESTLTYLNIDDNNFSSQDLSCFSRFTNLKELYMSSHEKNIKEGIYNRFNGSLERIKSLINLKKLGIESTDVNEGLEYLPMDLETIWCGSYGRKDASCLSVEKQLQNFRDTRYKEGYRFDSWKKEQINTMNQEMLEKTNI